MTLYEILGVSKNATPEEIKSAYKQQAKEHHPDKGGGVEQFQQIAEAYEVLSDKDRRARYDKTGLTDTPPPFASRFKDFVTAAVVPLFEDLNSPELNMLGKPVSDLIGLAAEIITKNLSQARKELLKLDRSIKAYEKSIPNIIYKGEGANVIKDSMQRQLDGLVNKVNRIKSECEFLDLCHTELQNYEYEVTDVLDHKALKGRITFNVDFGHFTQSNP